MPNIEAVPEVYYQPLDAYHHEVDNKPLSNILFRQGLINTRVDVNSGQLTNSQGTAGSLEARLDQSLEDSGALKVTAIDNELHNIASHADGNIDISGVPTSFVRMLDDERNKLALVSDEATDLSLRFETVGPSATPVVFDAGILPFEDSSSVAWRFDSGTIKADTVFSSSVAHQHVYDAEPVHVNTISPDFINYKTTTTSQVFTDGSLRVYINGVRLSEFESIYVPGPTPADDWTLMKVTPNPTAGTFALSTAITSDDVIRIDFDIAVS